jgi:hypothetical protein
MHPNNIDQLVGEGGGISLDNIATQRMPQKMASACVEGSHWIDLQIIAGRFFHGKYKGLAK